MTVKIANKVAKIGLGLSSLILLAVPLSASAADTTVSVDVSSVISAVTTEGTVALGGLTPDASGKQSINSDTVEVSTNDVSGFSLTLSDKDTTLTLVNADSDTFTPVGGTAAAPVALTDNTWGWRVDGLGGFDDGAAAVASNAAPSALKFAAITANSSPVTIKETTDNGTDSVDVWFSARANDEQPAGTYTGIVTYTAAANTP